MPLNSFDAEYGINRLFVAEREEGGFDAIRLAPIDRTALFAAKAAALIVYLLALELVAVPVFALFFLGEYTAMIAGSALIVVLFFGGYHIPGIPNGNGEGGFIPFPHFPLGTLPHTLIIRRASPPG